ncbi:Adenylate cyclase [Olavius algarvensis spirochete endosymbiont]|uniref:adenylate/guanylate cyclase domain-containing protein n=1 Tax=Olavius algarvensis spirochete endosymbiont TaxID=260710 RepID=UPI000F1FA477|nr:adenylate/guanylate cyclase domain-containing protein [Olavius algarvensis spirochete endosymbiont]VDA99260.1 Adenylate cyclase [Olavius algarvensis spirochete endosymbiont]
MQKKFETDDSKLQVRFPVALKLIIIVSLIVIVAMSVLTYISLSFFERETKNRIRDNNISLSQTVANQSEKEILQLLNSANLLFQIGLTSSGEVSLVEDFFANSRSLIFVGIPGNDFNFSNRDWFRTNGIFNESAILNSIIATHSEIVDKTRGGETFIINVSPLIPNLDSPVIALFTPFLFGTERQAFVVLADVGASFAESVQTQEGFTTTMIINSEGEILAHPDFARVLGGENIRNSEIFEKVYSQGVPRGQIIYEEKTDEGLVNVMGSFALISVGDLSVITTVRETDAFAVVKSIRVLNWTLLGIVLSFAILGIYFFSQSLSNPLKELALATVQIKIGNYNTIIRPRTRDEVGQLARSFSSMVPSLMARERLFQKTEAFVNKQVAQMIDDDTLPEYAETKEVTVFFSDIRNFTAKSEAMGNPQLVINNLSEYFRIMVPCVEQTQGTVDKFIGDAVMAVWGSMHELENSAENAINASLLMRSALRKFNVDRGSVERPIFQIGCGLNSGSATVGIMGDPSSKMEWAHMGDTVNLASRIEALNKPMGTDIIISQSTASRVEGIFSIVPLKRIKVKGKSKPQLLYAVLGRMDDETRPRSLGELRAMVGITNTFGASSDSEEHEVKYEILDS